MMCFLMIGFSGKTQMNVAAPLPQGANVFRYDEAGNQIFRGYECARCPLGLVEESNENKISENTTALNIDEEAFWNEIQIYPVPVKNVLTINWTDKADDLIAEISLYEQNTVHWKFQQKNIPSLNRQVQIDMTHYYMGVYILSFQLKDGRTISKNITKF